MTTVDPFSDSTPLPPSRSVWDLRWQRLRQHRPAAISMAILAVLVVFCFSAMPFTALMGIDSNAADLFERFSPPSANHWLGTDEIGRDVLSRLMVGGQISLAVGVLATLIGGVVGIAVGVLSGYLGGRTDAVLMRATDCMIALPLVPLLIVLGSVDLMKLGIPSDLANAPLVSFWRIVIIISLVDWTTIARVVRAGTLSVKNQDYVLAAKASGASALYNIFIHVLPNVTTPVIVAGTLTVGRVILLESTMSFLGFGILPPTPTWGNLLHNAQDLVAAAPLLAVYPGLLIFVTVITVNFVGDGLRVAFDPRSEH